MRDLSVYEIQAKRIYKKLQKLKSIDKNFKIFGSDSHKYKLSKPISIEELEKLEQNFNINLPDEYVTFITKLGNGGAGPCYGIYDIAHALKRAEITEEDYEDETEVYADITKPSIFESEENLKTYKRKTEALKNYDEQYNSGIRALDGTLAINTSGCSYFYHIILNGCNKGKMFEFCGDMVEFILFDYDKLIGFLDWYESWLDKSIKYLQ